MQAESPRIPYPGKLQTLIDGSPFAGLPAGLASRVAYLLAFSKRVPEARETLIKLRQDHKLSRGHLAAMLGASLNTLRRWEDGSRKPSGTARKLIWLLGEIVEGEPPKSPTALAFWKLVGEPDREAMEARLNRSGDEDQ